MRKIEQWMVDTIKAGKPGSYTKDNTQVIIEPNDVKVLLHGNLIYHQHGTHTTISMCGWGSVTTRSRLTALGTMSHYRWQVAQRNYGQYIIMHNLREPLDKGPVCIDPGKCYVVGNLGVINARYFKQQP